jgi:hypothetical protein
MMYEAVDPIEPSIWLQGIVVLWLHLQDVMAWIAYVLLAKVGCENPSENIE